MTAVLVERYTPQAKALLRTWDRQGIQAAAPALFRYEIVAVMRKRMSIAAS
ncbi:MAG: hypothetical protein JXB47_07425 [Anaerolineae bacterium]|nr:hypothetical protein [Anaerolineae bacterium]